MRQVQVKDVRAAVEWFTAVDPVVPSNRPRRVAARRVFWGTLRELGFTITEIAEESYCSQPAVSMALRDHPPDSDDVGTVLAKARDLVAADTI